MHELGIALEIVDVVSRRAGARRVEKITVTVGVLSAVLPDSLRFCFGLATEGTPAAGAELEIRERPGLARCRACASEFELLRPFGRCGCGETDLDWLRGEELEVSEILLEAV
ncbi:MAG TPA: hydrogenase maturation nickel metallochaperone HypA [Polyangiaceae bacterium]|nr:hydrogenase maturation nickel metallochaperone HypA [Polyangiaceae bacterium]